MSGSRRMLTLGAIGNFVVAFTHLVFIVAGEEVLHFFGAPRSVMAMPKLSFVLLLVAVAGLFSLFALYGLSAAGSIRRLPFLRTALIAIGVIYVLRGATIGVDVLVIVRTAGKYLQFAAFSLFALCIGLLYLRGAIGMWKQLRPAVAGRQKD